MKRVALFVVGALFAVSVSAQGSLIALAEIEKGELRPRRIFNLPRT